jgi:hypothetical protein
MLPVKRLPPMRWKKEWTGFLLLLLGLRVLYGALGVWVVRSGGPLPLQEPVYAEMKPYLQTGLLSEYLVNPWFQWDTVSYLKIAIQGYEQDATVAFMPLYPLSIRGMAALLGGHSLLAALVVSTACAFLALVLMFELFRARYPAETAWQAVLVFLSFPTAFFLLAGYTEALFLTFVLAFWILVDREQWMWAGLFAALATVTRFQGLVLSGVLFWMILFRQVEQPAPGMSGQLRQVLGVLWSLRPRRITPAGVSAGLAVLFPLAAAAGYQAWLKAAGLGTIAGALREYWRLETVPPWTGVLLFLQRLANARFSYMDWIDLALLVIITLAALLGLRRLDPAFSLYIWLTLAVLWMRGTPPHLLASFSRYFLTLFPLALLPALSSNRYGRLAVVVVFFAFQILLATIFLWGSWVA